MNLTYAVTYTRTTYTRRALHKGDLHIKGPYTRVALHMKGLTQGELTHEGPYTRGTLRMRGVLYTADLRHQ